MEPNPGLFLAGLLMFVAAFYVEEDMRKHRGKLKVDIAGQKFEASGPVYFVLFAFSGFLVAIAYLIPA